MTTKSFLGAFVGVRRSWVRFAGRAVAAWAAALILTIFVSLTAPSSARAASPADWATFTSTAPQNWSVSGSWTAGTGVPTPGPSLVIDFDPGKVGTTTSGGNVTANFTATNDIGTVQLNALNLAGQSSSTTARTITISGGALQFTGTNAALSNTTTSNGATGTVNYTIGSAVSLDSSLAVNLGGTGLTTLTGTVSAASAGLKTITVTGSGNLTFSSTSVISDGSSGQVGIVQAGTGVLTVSGTANAFTGEVTIKSGTIVAGGSAAALGTGNMIRVGDTSGAAANATLTLGSATYANAVVVQAGNAGTATIQNSGTSTSTSLSSVLTLNKDATVSNTANFTLGGGLSGSGNVTFVNSSAGGTGNITISGANAGFTGNVAVTAGTTRVNNASALGVANTVSVDSASGATFNVNNFSLTLAGLNNGANGGGTVTNTGASAKTLTLGGGGTYRFDGAITASMAANLSLVKSGTGTQTLGGANTYAGTTSVNGGTLLVDGTLASASAVSVAAATLGGSGTVGGTVTTGGTSSVVSAGDGGAGTLTVGALNAANGATLAFSLGTASTQLAVTGLLTGSTAPGALQLLISDAGGLATGTAYTILSFGSASGLDASDFSLAGSGLVLDSSFGTNGILIGANTVQIRFAAIPEPGLRELLLAGAACLILASLARRRHRAAA